MEARETWEAHQNDPDSVELYRFQCEVRELMRLRVKNGKQWFIEFIYGKAFDKRRERLMTAMYEQWIRGHRGEEGVWFDE